MTLHSRFRSILPDGMDETRLVIVKGCSTLRLTNEIRSAAMAAQEKQVEPVLAVPPSCVLDPELARFIEDRGIAIFRVE